MKNIHSPSTGQHHPIDESRARIIVMGEIDMLETHMRNAYSIFSNNYHGGRRLWSSKTSKPVITSIASETDEEEDTFIDDLGNGGSIPSGSNQQLTKSIRDAYCGLKKLMEKLVRNLNPLADISYLVPFCEVIKDPDISGPITDLALRSLIKFLRKGLIDATEEMGSAQYVGDSIIKARFVATDSANDEIVLMRILTALREIIIRGFKSISNDTVCEIMQSCFRIASEFRLSEILRETSRQALEDMVEVLFSRIHEFDDISPGYGTVVKISGPVKFPTLGSNRKVKSSESQIKSTTSTASVVPQPQQQTQSSSSITTTSSVSLAPSPISSQSTLSTTTNTTAITTAEVNQSTNLQTTNTLSGQPTEFVNRHGIKFSEDAAIPRPLDTLARKLGRKSYDLVCIHELLTYLTSLINPLPESNNTDANVNLGLKLLTVAFETAVDEIGNKQCLLAIVKNELCWNLLLLLQHDKHLTPFVSSLWLSFIIFSSLRIHLKYQLEALIIRLMDIIGTGNAPTEFRRIALERLYSFFQHIPHLCHEIFINYDCDPYASNLLEDILNLLSKKCFDVALTHPVIGNNPSQPLPNTFSTIQTISLKTLLECLKSLQRVELKPNDMVLKFTDVEVLQFIQAIPQPSDLNTNEGPSESKELEPTDSDDNNPNSPQHTAVDSLSAESNLEESTLTEIVVVRDECDSPVKGSVSVKNEDPEVIPVITRRKPKVLYLPKSVSEIEKLKHKKKLLWMASEQFNAKPSKGINFLQEHKLVSDENEIVNFIRDNSRLDKKQIGEYLANKKNLAVLESFVQSFMFKGLRIDEALRLYLESFRLPGESPLITLVLEQFAHHWFESNDKPFASEDAAFSLAYAVIMLNVEHHNANAKKQKEPMTCDEFINMLRQVNGGQDFDPNLLREIYITIKNNEIVMPAEQHGIVREKYLWKCLLRRSETDSGTYWFATESISPISMGDNSNEEDRCLQLSLMNGPVFKILWGPALSAMTFVFDKINVNQNTALTRKILNQGFTVCALLCAKYGHLDNLISSLCKFTINSAGGPTSPLLTRKSQLAAQCLFKIAREYVNEIRLAWTEIVKMILNWFIAKFLEESLEFEDFALGGRHIKMKRKEKPKPVNKSANEGSSNFLSSFYSYFAGNQEEASISSDGYSSGYASNVRDSSDCDFNSQSTEVIQSYCKPLSIIEESKFLHTDSLVELIKALINVDIELEDEAGDDVEAFRLEMILQIILSNRDRASVFWSHLQSYLQTVSKTCNQSELFAERYVSAIFRLAIRFSPRPDAFSEQIYQLIQLMLTTFEPRVFQKHYTATALHSFITHVHSSLVKIETWRLIFDALLYVGIGYRPPGTFKVSGSTGMTKGSVESINFLSDNEENPRNLKESSSSGSLQGRGYTSDSEINSQNTLRSGSLESINSDGGSGSGNPYKLMTGDSIGTGKGSVYSITDLSAYEKCTEILTLIIREILPKNLITTNGQEIDEFSSSVTQMAIDTLRKFVEASVKINTIYKHGYHHYHHHSNLRRSTSYNNSGLRTGQSSRSSNQSYSSRRNTATGSSGACSDSEEEFSNLSEIAEGDEVAKQKLVSLTESCSLKLLDLMHYLHLNAGLTSDHCANEYLWSSVWCPLLQGIALLCCDSRRPVRTCALTFLQRALLNHDMRILNAHQWESCFNKVLFPLLAKLLEPLNTRDPVGMDETRMRATNLLCKVFLQHLQPLLDLPTFTALWLTILDFMDKYMKAEMQTDLVKEAIPESLKNMLLVMDTANCFNSALSSITWDRIHCFLPNLKEEIMPPQPPPQPPQPQQPLQAQQPLQTSQPPQSPQSSQSQLPQFPQHFTISTQPQQPPHPQLTQLAQIPGLPGLPQLTQLSQLPQSTPSVPPASSIE
ncbi:Golgi-specific brefeldin A-resistance guanine nucleotide exchange factor 1 [Tetranychus urticae]|uniref:Golgi-specific brefeldin A-resistance guanine nucleotide exchange factor 1 n=1 Tax=Tetranychus urticae TaxID=32264 RepID=UPI00077C0414|nr:Golgi-specific brefeldin A-resistance guanine nucleotide exchange factor 1 [Tetranychus urticae]